MSFGRMSWEPPEIIRIADWSAWWMQWLETDWAPEETIINEIGPEYLMYYDMEALPPEKHVFP